MHKLAEKIAECLKAKVEGKGIDNIEGQDLVELGMWTDIIKDIAEYDKAMREIEEMDAEGEEDDSERRYYRGQPRDSMGRYMSRRGRGRGGRRGYIEPMYYTVPEIYGGEDMEMYRDMDRVDGRMYYSGGSTGGGSGSSGGSSGNSSSGGRGGMSSGGSQGGQSGGGSRYYDGERGRQSEGGNYATRMQDGGRDSREGKSGQSRRGYMETKEMHKDNSPESKQAKMKELEKYMGELGADITEMISDASPEEKSLLKQKMQTLIQKI